MRVPEGMKMFSAPQPAVVHLFTIFRQIEAGEIRIPAFQREFVWKDRQIIDLLTSVRDQYPIGSILLWSVDRKMLEIASNRVTAFPDVPENYPTNYVLDGMQRLSTLYGAFHYQNGQSGSFDVYYDLRNRKFFQSYDREAFNTDASLPLASLISPRKLLEHQAQLLKLPDSDQLLDELLRTQAAFQDYMIPVVRIQGADVDRIVGIFERTNSTGTRLDTVDFMRAITWNKAFDLNNYLDIARGALPSGFDLSDETIIKCVGLLLNVPPSSEGLLSLRDRKPDELELAFRSFTLAFEKVAAFLSERLKIQHLSYVPYEGQLLVLFKTIGMGEASSSTEFDQIERWFWAIGFNESLRGKPDHYVVRAVQNWRALIAGQIRGLEPRLRLSDEDFYERRLIRGKALSSAFVTMFAVREAKSLSTGKTVPPALYMSTPSLDAFDIIFSSRELRDAGLDIGPSPRIFPNVILTNAMENAVANQQTMLDHMRSLRKEGKFDVLASQFIDRSAADALECGSILVFLNTRARMIRSVAKHLVER